jgi:hypothetical protein
MPAIFAQLHLRFIDGDLNQPSAELRFLPKTRKILESL